MTEHETKLFPYELIHTPGCGGPAFYLSRIPEQFEPLLASSIQHVDGTPASSGEFLVCGTCGHLLALYARDNIRERESRCVVVMKHAAVGPSWTGDGHTCECGEYVDYDPWPRPPLPHEIPLMKLAALGLAKPFEDVARDLAGVSYAPAIKCLDHASESLKALAGDIADFPSEAARPCDRIPGWLWPLAAAVLIGLIIAGVR